MERLKKLPQEELVLLALTKGKIDIAEARLETAQAQVDLAVVNFKYHMLSVFNKLGLPSDCKISEDGTIIYGDDYKDTIPSEKMPG